VDLSGTEPGDRDRRAEEFLNDIEAGTFGLCEMPLVRAVLGRFDRRDAVLVLAAHHTAVDGWSIHLVLRDLARFYAARRLHRPVDLPPVRQYREYVAWQRANATGPEVTAARAYWREVLRDARVVPTATDKPRADGEFVTAWHRFLLPEKYRTATLELAGETRSSPFMVLLAAYLTYLRELSGETDLVVPTFTPGRHPAWVLDTVGSFYNFLPLRVDIAGCAGFRDVIARARATCLAAYAHEVPFTHIDAEAPELMSVAIGEHTAASLFQVTQSPHMMGGEQIGDLRVTAMRRRAVSASVGSQIPDGVLWGLEPHPAGGIIGSLGYTTNLFGEATIAGMVSDFRRVLDGTVARGR